MKDLHYSPTLWRQNALHPKEGNPEADVNWIFLVDLLNFSFFCDHGVEPYAVTLDGARYTGYWSLCASMNRALRRGVPCTSAAWMANATAEDVAAELFTVEAGSGPVPLLAERAKSIREAGAVLLEKFGGTFVNVIKAADMRAQNLISIVLDNFPTFRDYADYDDMRISIFKRVQILVADLWACFEGKSYGEFVDIDTITMFADYRLPQGLVALGALEYSVELLDLLHRGVPLESRSRMEVEIRACSIWAVELIRRRIVDLSQHKEEVNAILIDFYLWDFIKKHEANISTKVPFHRTRCIFY